MKRALALLALALPLAAPAAEARTVTVRPDGSGGAPTIQAGLDAAAAGDTVLVACGTYFETLTMKSGVVLRSETGDPDCVTVDARGNGRVVLCEEVDASSEIVGLTFTNGRLVSPCDDPGLGAYCMGAGMLCVASAPRIRNCAFVANDSPDNGGGVTCVFSSPRFVDCVFRDNAAHVGAGLLSAFPPGHPELVRCLFTGNAATTDGAAIYVFGTELTVTACTIARNAAGEDGGGIFWISPAPGTVERTIVSSSLGGEAIACGLGASVPQLSCCDLFGNAGGDWTGCIGAQAALAGNFSADPRFCDPERGVFTLDGSSPCAPSGECDLVGALGVGCAVTAAHADVRATSWGSVKSLYR